MEISESDLIEEIIDALSRSSLLSRAPDLCVTRLAGNDAVVEVGDRSFVIVVEESYPPGSRHHS